MLFWPDATVELSEEPQTASDELVTLLLHNDMLEQQRRINIYQTLGHHDWRYRIEDLCRMFALPVPDSLQKDIVHLHELCTSFAPTT